METKEVWSTTEYLRPSNETWVSRSTYSEAHLWNKSFHHDWEDDTPKARARSSNSKSEGTLFEEPGNNRCHSRVENHTGS